MAKKTGPSRQGRQNRRSKRSSDNASASDVERADTAAEEAAEDGTFSMAVDGKSGGEAGGEAGGETEGGIEGGGDEVTRNLCQQVRSLRKKRGWSLEELSAACGVSRSMLSQIERAQVNPTLAVAHRIALAFGLSLGRMLDNSQASTEIDVIRADDRTYHYRSDRKCRIRTLSPLHLEKDVEFYELVLQVGGELRSSAHFRGTREFLTVQSGQLHVTSDQESSSLQAGDSAQYRADVPHAIVNTGSIPAIAFMVVIYPP